MCMRVFIIHSGFDPEETLHNSSFCAKDVPDGWTVCMSSSLSDPRALRSRMHLHPSSKEMQQEPLSKEETRCRSVRSLFTITSTLLK